MTLLNSRWLKKKTIKNQSRKQSRTHQISVILLFTFFKYQIKWNNQMLRTEGLWSVMREHLSICALLSRLVYLRVFPLCLLCLARWLYFLACGHKYKYWAVSLLVSSVTVIIFVITRRVTWRPRHSRGDYPSDDCVYIFTYISILMCVLLIL